MRNLTAGLAAVAFASGLAFGGFVSEAQAQRARDRGDPAYVYADSKFGHGSISGPIRRGRNGLEVRMPRGTWLECKRSCSETLRLATVDFWETQGRTPPDGGPNYFSFDLWF